MTDKLLLMDARRSILNAYESMPKFNKRTTFLKVRMGTCIVYTPASHIKRDMAMLFKSRIEQLYIYTQKIVVNKVAES